MKSFSQINLFLYCFFFCVSNLTLQFLAFFGATQAMLLIFLIFPAPGKLLLVARHLLMAVANNGGATAVAPLAGTLYRAGVPPPPTCPPSITFRNNRNGLGLKTMTQNYVLRKWGRIFFHVPHIFEATVVLTQQLASCQRDTSPIEPPDFVLDICRQGGCGVNGSVNFFASRIFLGPDDRFFTLKLFSTQSEDVLRVWAEFVL